MDRQTDRQVRSSCSPHETCRARLCRGTDLSSCPVQPGRVSLSECWALPFHCSLPSTLPDVFQKSWALTASFGWEVSQEGRCLCLWKWDPRGLQWKKNQTLRFEVREGQGSDASHQTGLHPELTRLMPRQGGPVHGWGRLFTSWAVFLSPFPFGATLQLAWLHAWPPGISLGWFMSPGTSFTFHITRPVTKGEFIH